MQVVGHRVVAPRVADGAPEPWNLPGGAHQFECTAGPERLAELDGFDVRGDDGRIDAEAVKPVAVEDLLGTRVEALLLGQIGFG